MNKPSVDEATPKRHEMDRLKVFVSYSRHDTRFACELIAGLEYDGGFETLVDSQSILEGEEWKARISALIADAGTMIIVLSPSWLASEICRWELEEAWRHSKRVLPVQPFALGDASVPPRLSAINYVRFDQIPDGTPRLFMDGMSALRRALVTDLVWVREHTRLLTKASEWDAAGRIGNRMLSGGDITSAKHWLEKRPSGAPDPTELHRDYIAASEQAEAARLSVERQRAEALQRAFVRTRAALIVASIAGLATAGAGGFAYVKKLDAQRSQQRAAQERDAALVVQSRHLTDISARQIEAGDAGTAMLLALAGLPDEAARRAAAAETAARPYLPELEGRLYESRFVNREQLLLGGHQGAVLGVALSADGTRVVTGSADQKVRVWTTATGREPLVIDLADGPVNAVAFTPDGTRVVAGSGGAAHILDAQTGKSVLDSKGQGGDVLCVAVNAGGSRIVTGYDDGTARMWDASSGKEIVVFAGQAGVPGHTGPVTSVAVSGDGATVVTGSSDATAIVWAWDGVTAKQTAVVKAHTLAVSSVALSADAKTFVTGAADKSIRTWQTATGLPQGAVIGTNDAVNSIAIDAEGKRIASGAPDGTVRVWDADSATELQVFSGHAGGVTRVGFSADGQRVVSSSRDGTARLWATGLSADTINLDGHTAAITSVAITEDGTRVVTGSRDKTARLWSPGSGNPPVVLDGSGAEVAGVAISRDGARVVTGTQDNLGRVWDASGAKVLAELKGHEGPVSSVALSPDAQRAATGSEDKTARIWNAATGEQLAILQPHATRVTSLSFSPNGERVLTGSGTTVRLWDAASGEHLAVFMGHTGSVLAVALSPDGQLAASGGRDASVRVWSIAGQNRTPKFNLRAPEGAATSVAFSSDGKRILSGWSDGRMRIWDAATGELITNIAMHDAPISGVAVATSGGRMVATASDGRARIATYFADTASLVGRAKADATRCLTPEQRIKFHLDAAPPRWCITGGGREQEADPARWQPLWPYLTVEWRKWLQATDRGEKVPLPEL